MGKDFGGKMSLRLSSGELISLRGTFNVSPTRQEISSVTNQDNTTDRISTPQASRVEIVAADGGFDYEKLMNGPRFNATLVEEFTGITHYMTNAFFVGRPQINRLNGEVSGLSIDGDYSKGSN